MSIVVPGFAAGETDDLVAGRASIGIDGIYGAAIGATLGPYGWDVRIHRLPALLTGGFIYRVFFAAMRAE